MELGKNGQDGTEAGSGISIDAVALSHAVIVWGGSLSVRDAYVGQLAQAAVCSAPGKKPCLRCAHCLKSARGIHPDIIVVDRLEDRQSIVVDQIRAVREDAVVLPNDAEKKVYIIRQAGLMTAQAQNAFLKLLEEPPACSSFILAVDNPAELLPTVRSRCVELQCRRQDRGPTDNNTVTAFEEALTGGTLKLNAFSYALEKLDKTSFADFLSGAADMLTRRLRAAATSPENGRRGGGNPADGNPADGLLNAVRVLTRAKEYFDANVSLVHIAGMICAELTPDEE